MSTAGFISTTPVEITLCFGVLVVKIPASGKDPGEHIPLIDLRLQEVVG